MLVKVRSPINIAVLKYWGKADEKLIIPKNTSISLTLDVKEIFSETTVICSENASEHSLQLNGEATKLTHRMENVIAQAQRMAVDLGLQHATWKLNIISENNFPTAAGLASSASGLSALAFALGQLYHLPETAVISLARLGSGSACRSLLGGFVEWRCPSDIVDDGAEVVQLYAASHWPDICILICQVNKSEKSVPSTNAMQRTVCTSELYRYRINETVSQHRHQLHQAIRDRNFDLFAEVAMRESNQLHAVCLDSYPPITYLSSMSTTIQSWIHQLNEVHGRTMAAYTFDAGPNAFLFCLQADAPLLMHLLYQSLRKRNEDNSSINTFVKGGKQLLESLEVPSLGVVQNLMTKLTVSGEVVERVIFSQIGSGPVVESLGMFTS